MTPGRRAALTAATVAFLLAGCNSPIKTTRQVNTTTACTAEFETLSDTVYGTAGRLCSEELGIDVALYETDITNPVENQTVVDAKDSAACMYFGSKVIIADHNYQAFEGLLSAYENCSATIEKNDRNGTNLVCREVHQHSRLADGDLYDENGNDALHCDYPVIIYTCNPSLFGNTDSVTATYWDYG